MPPKGLSTYLLHNRLHKKRFDTGLNELSTRAINVLRGYSIDTYDQFYDQLFIKNNIRGFHGLRNSGLMTQVELIHFTRGVFDPEGRFSDFVYSFEKDLSNLSPRARGVLRQAGISIFETYFYKMVLNPQKKDFQSSLRAGPETVEELEVFHQKFCTLIGEETMKTKNKFNNTSTGNRFSEKTVRKAQTAFKTGYKSLSKETKKILTDKDASSLDGFYEEYISEYSQLSLLLTQMGPENLIEVLKLRTLCDSILKESKDR
jgi:hypothetical protein